MKKKFRCPNCGATSDCEGKKHFEKALTDKANEKQQK